MSISIKLNQISHRRLNILTGEWILVSPHRLNRPWQGSIEKRSEIKLPEYVEDCYLCPGNLRANGERNPDYKNQFVFLNDYSALTNVNNIETNSVNLLVAKPESGICKVVCFSPKHNLTLPLMESKDIINVVDVWQNEFIELSKMRNINYIQIFENKGELMGCSNPHPHCQIWAQESIPTLPMKETKCMKDYFSKKRNCLLCDYIEVEKKAGERIIYENDDFILLIPFWATWPFELLIVSKRHIKDLGNFSKTEKLSFAEILKLATTKYDNLFNISFPYSSGIHQAPTDNNEHTEWHFHMHFYPPLLRAADVRKFMVGYEMLAEPQRDITPETAAEILRKTSNIHFSKTTV
ncbi:MAG: UDP-glucose--hexose-1-phosphate uridylyltransferase [Ignavibacteriales bacterium]|nr:UDP-glucose--hexose-1-phosphate uridylyltransferase [Ignavibacteriales bacterium]